MTKRAKTALSLLAAIGSVALLASVIWLVENLICDEDTAKNLQLGLQFFTSSWPAQWPDVFDRQSPWFALGVLSRLSLIVSPTIFTATLLWQFYKVRNRGMRVIEAIQLRDNAIEAEFLKGIPEDQREAAREKLRKSVDRGTSDWASKFLPAAFPNVPIGDILRRFGEQRLF
jgi:hypothetical protein